MKRVVIDQFGGPEVLRVVEEDAPRPGQGEVRVRVLAVGVSFTDAQIRAGTYMGGPKPPFTPGYSQRHYGRATYRLVDPKVIVEHYTETSTAQAAYNTFAPDTPDPELHELPNVCAHFLVDNDGTIYELVPLSMRCRHTVGLNYTAIGIENVGSSDQEILANRAPPYPASRRIAATICSLVQRLRFAITADWHLRAASRPARRWPSPRRPSPLAVRLATWPPGSTQRT